MSKRKKYSLEERINYYNNIFDKTSKNDFNGDKCQFALGFVQSLSIGVPADLNNRSKAFKNGVRRGLQAEKKSRSIRF